MAMLSEEDLVDFITQAALLACNADVKAHRKPLWDACIAIMADCLRTTDEFSRERLLHGLEDELRTSIVRLDQLLKPTPRNPLNPLNLN